MTKRQDQGDGVPAVDPGLPDGMRDDDAYTDDHPRLDTIRTNGHRSEAEATSLIDALYTLSDITSEISRGAAGRPAGLSDPEDVGIIDDVIDLLQDPDHGLFARTVLRDALAEIAMHALARTGWKMG